MVKHFQTGTAGRIGFIRGTLILFIAVFVLSACDTGGGSSNEAADLLTCADSPCLNGATCTDLDSTTYACGCTPGFSGDRCECTVAASQTRNFRNIGTSVESSLSYPDLVVTGSADINVLNANGLGIVGGRSDNTVDGSEQLIFTFNTPTYDVEYFQSMGGNLDLDAFVGESFIEPFDDQGTSLGVTPNNGTGTVDVSATVAEVPIGSFTLTADVDNFRIGSVSYSPLVCAL